MTHVLRYHCPCKINLALSVAAPQPPKGYHPIASWMAALALGDELTLTLATKGCSTYDLAFTPACPRQLIVDWPLERDLCVRAHRLLEQHVGRALPVHLSLRKNVPSGGGLGGGSSDAAYTLIAIDALFHLTLDEGTLVKLAMQLGSDVPFFIGVARGQPWALVSGLGELLEPLPVTQTLSLVLIFPDFGTSTAQVYQAFDRALVTPDKQTETQRIRQLTQLHPLPPDAPFNDLAEPACAVTPALRDAMARIRTRSPYPVHVSGSGSTLYVLTPHCNSARELAELIQRDLQFATLATQSLSPSVHG